MQQAVRAVKDGTYKPMTSDGDESSKTKSVLRAYGLDCKTICDDDGYELYHRTVGGMAIIEVVGPVVKGVSSFGGASGLLIRKAIRRAREDSMVNSCMLYIDSPGGRGDVPAAVVDELKAFKAAGKKLYAYVDGMACSAAYWMACPADKIYCGRTDMAGCIGAYCVLYDDTGWQEEHGIKSVLVKTGRYKGLGADGKVTDDLTEDVERELNELMEPFLADIAEGRELNIERVRELADGRSHLGDNALALGLVDQVTTYEAAIGEIIMTPEQFEQYAAANPDAVKKLAQVQKIAADEYARGKSETEAALKPKNATSRELKGAFPEDSGFVMDRLEVDAPLSDHKIAYVDYLAKKTVALSQENDQLKAKLAEIDPAQAGTQPVGTKPGKAGDGDTKMSAEREQELLNMSPLGQAALAQRK